MVSQRRLGRPICQLTLVGAVVAMGVLASCGGDPGSRTATDGAGDSTNATETQTAQGTFEQETVTVGTAAPAALTERQFDATGPILQWAEFDPAIDGPGTLFSTGDGRVVISGETSAGASLLATTSDGADWSVVPLPANLSLHAFDLTGARWAVAGWPHDDPSDADFRVVRIYISDDQGASWAEATLQTDAPVLPEHTIAHIYVHAVATSGAQVVALTSTHLALDFEALLAERGLLPAGAQMHGISIGGDRVDVWLYEASSEADSHLQDPQGTDETALTFTADELDLSEEQRAIMERPMPGRSLRAYSGAGTELAEVLRLDGWSVSAVGNDEGFVLLTQTSEDGIKRVTSPDGENWAAELLDPSLVHGWPSATALGPDGTVWIVSSEGAESYLTKWSTGGARPTTTWLGTLSSSGEVSAGPAGLAMSAFPPPDPPAGAGDHSGLPTGRVAKDGYELRYGEPTGGISLWDIAADEPVYEFGREVIESGELPEGVREVEGDGIFELTFEDPVTGEELVTFTLEDLEAVFGVRGDSSDWSDMDMWVGWSSDGAAWGWQSAREAFGLGDVEAHVEVAVGSDVVIASVWAFAPVEASSLASGAASGRDIIIEKEPSVDPGAASTGQRWFIARVP